MRVRKIVAFLLASLLAVSFLTLFSFADGEELALKDSGSPAVSMMSMRAIAADEGISLAAAEGNSGQFGYDIKPVDIDYSIGYSNYTNPSSGNKFKRSFIQVYNLEPGSYSFTVKSLNAVTSAYVYYWDTQLSQYTSNLGTSVKFDFSLTSQTTITLWLYAPVDSFDSYDQNTVLSITPSVLKPVEGISCGYTFNSGVINDNNISSRLEYVTWDFGSQPAGNYLINIYTYGQNYDVDFDIVVGSDIIQDRKVSVSKSTGLYTCLISHGGGDLSLKANFTYKKSTLNSPLGGSSSTNGTWYEGTGSVFGTGTVSIVSSGNWIFNITDVVAVPLSSAGLEQFGVFGPLVGFLRDGFSSLKANVVNQFTQLKSSLVTEFTNLKSSITTQFTQLKTQLTTQYNGMKTFIEQQVTRIVGDDSTKNDVQDAADELNKEVQDLNNLSGQLDTQSGSLEQQFSTDFAIPDFVSVQGSNFQSIYSTLFGSLGVFGIFIWLPVVLAVIKRLLRL